MNKCVFLDRDGVLNQDLEGYLFNPDELEIPTGVAEGLRLLKEAGFLLIVITNQAGIAKGLYQKEDVEGVHRRIAELTSVQLDDLYFAPHHPDYTTRSLSRKPGSLLIERAIAKYDIDPETSWMIGDKERDIQAGQGAGVRTILLAPNPPDTAADFTAADFATASRCILQH